MFCPVRCLIVVFGGFFGNITLLGNKELMALYFHWSVACVLSVTVCWLILLVSLVGYDL